MGMENHPLTRLDAGHANMPAKPTKQNFYVIFDRHKIGSSKMTIEMAGS